MDTKNITYEMFKCDEPTPFTKHTYPRVVVDTAIENYKCGFGTIGQNITKQDFNYILNLNDVGFKVESVYVDANNMFCCDIIPIPTNASRGVFESGMVLSMSPCSRCIIGEDNIISQMEIQFFNLSLAPSDKQTQ